MTVELNVGDLVEKVEASGYRKIIRIVRVTKTFAFSVNDTYKFKREADCYVGDSSSVSVHRYKDGWTKDYYKLIHQVNGPLDAVEYLANNYKVSTDTKGYKLFTYTAENKYK